MTDTSTKPHVSPFHPDHPLVECSDADCRERYTACELGNHYCPSCGESCEGAEEVCEGCPCIAQGGLGPCCFCSEVHG